MKRKKNNFNEILYNDSGLFGGFVAQIESKNLFDDIYNAKLSEDEFSKKYNYLNRDKLNNISNESNFTPLMWAIYLDQRKYVKVLLDLGADINAKVNISLSKEEVIARDFMQVKIFSKEIISTSDVPIVVKYDGWHTPLTLAIQCQCDQIFDLLLTYKPDIHALVYKNEIDQSNAEIQQEFYGINAFSYAVIFENNYVVNKLISYCQSKEEIQTMINKKTDDICVAQNRYNGAILNGGYPLFYAVRNIDFEIMAEIIALLLLNGADTSLSVKMKSRYEDLIYANSRDIYLKNYIFLYANSYVFGSPIYMLLQIFERYAIFNDVQKDCLKTFVDLYTDVTAFMFSDKQWETMWFMTQSYHHFNFSDQFPIQYSDQAYTGHLVHALLASELKNLNFDLKLPTFFGLNFLPVLFDDDELGKQVNNISPLTMSINEKNTDCIAFCVRNQFRPFDPKKLRSMLGDDLNSLYQNYKDQHEAFNLSNEGIMRSCAMRLSGKLYTQQSGYPYFFTTQPDQANDDDEEFEILPDEAHPETALIPYVLMLQKKEVLEIVDRLFESMGSQNDDRYDDETVYDVPIENFLFRIHAFTNQILKQEASLEDKLNTDAMLKFVNDFPWLFDASAIIKYPYVRAVYQQHINDHRSINHKEISGYEENEENIKSISVNEYIRFLMEKEMGFLIEPDKWFLLNHMLEHCDDHPSLWDKFPMIKAGKDNFRTVVPQCLSEDIIFKNIISYYGPSVRMFKSIKISPYSDIDLLNISPAIKNHFKAFIEDCIVNNGQLDTFVTCYCATKLQYNFSAEMMGIIEKYARGYERSEMLEYLQGENTAKIVAQRI